MPKYCTLALNVIDQAMLFSDKSEVRSLHFIPRQPCFSKARVEWHEVILNGHADTAQPIIDLSHEDLTDLTFDLFGPMSFIELFDFYQACLSEKRLSQTINWDRLFQLNNKSWSQRSENLFKKLADCQPQFVDWCFQRKLDQRDLHPLLSLNNLALFNQIAPYFSEFQVSRNEGKAILDLLADLLLLEKLPSELIPENGQDWLNLLQKMRFPHAYQENKKSGEQAHWPKYAQEQKFRDGDRWQHKLNIQFSDHQDLKNKLKNLSEQVSN